MEKSKGKKEGKQEKNKSKKYHLRKGRNRVGVSYKKIRTYIRKMLYKIERWWYTRGKSNAFEDNLVFVL